MAGIVGRIVGGTRAVAHSQPWVAHFWFQTTTVCGGALISRWHVLSAAHCNRKGELTHAVLGDHNLVERDVGEERYKIRKWHYHPKVLSLSPEGPVIHDFAIAELDTAVSFTQFIKPVRLPSKNSNYVGRTAMVSGWGLMKHRGKVYPDVLRTVNVTVAEPKMCDAAWWSTWGRRHKIPYDYDAMLCAKGLKKDACRGDSGGMILDKGQDLEHSLYHNII